MKNDIKLYENSLASALKEATWAQTNLATERRRLGLRAESKLFLTRVEADAEIKAAVLTANARSMAQWPAIIDAVRATDNPKRESKLSAFAKVDWTFKSPKSRAIAAWVDTVAQAHEIVQRDRIAKRTQSGGEFAEATVTTTDRIVRAAAIARGEIVELPSDPTARAIVLAGRKARGEGE